MVLFIHLHFGLIFVSIVYMLMYVTGTFLYKTFWMSSKSAVIAVKVSTDACEKHAFNPSKVSITDPMTIGFGFYDN